MAPSAGLVVFTGALATRQHRLLHVGAYAGAAAAVVLLARRSERDATAAWFANERPRIATGLLGAGAAIAATVVAVTAVSAQVPFADRPAIVNWREGTEREPKGARQVVSPIVSTRNRLVNQSATELFTVKADRPSYWRLTALETFDGVAFGPGGRYRKVGKKLPDGLPVDAPSERLDQEVRITGLASDWLPVAYRPVSLRGPKRTAYDAETSSVLAPERTAIGLEYRASSSLARFDGTRMTSAASLDPPAPRSQLERNLALPPAFSPSLRGFAQALTASANTPFEKARALQDYFRTNFTYDLAVPAPQQPKNLTDFVLNSRRGYCEQFSTSFAAMARSIGIPARVAVGFTPGELTEGTFHVAGRNAHAWPEVYLDGFGWVPFEPTPGRAIPDGEAYTGVTYDPTEGLPLPTTTTATTATTVAGAAPATTVPASAPPPSTVTPARRFPLTTGRAMALIAGLFLLVGPVGRAAARRRRRSHLTRVGADVAVERAWDEITAELSWRGVNADAQETSSSLAARAHGVLSPDGAVGVAALAEQLDVVRWSPDGRAADGGHRTAVDLRAVTALVRADVRSRIPRLRRVRRVMDPRLTRRPSRCRRRVASEPDRG